MAKINLKRAKFYCESCGSEVPQNAKFCSTCGKFFTFVRCPNCHFTGDSKIFTNGCPKCGYAVHSQNNKDGMRSSKENKNGLSGLFSGNKNTEDSSLPAWIYIATVVVLLAVLFGVYSCL